MCKFDFLGDSIVEAANNSIKKGPIKMSTQMDLSCSGFTRLKATEAISTKKYCDYAKNINNTIWWSLSNTSQYLTSYTEGLSCRYFDRRNKYTICSIKK